MKYVFIQAHRREHAVRTLCRVIGVHPSGYYVWRGEPQSRRAVEDRRLSGHIKQAWLESGGVYGYRKVHDDLRDPGDNRIQRANDRSW